MQKKHSWSRILERTISLRFLCTRVLRLLVSYTMFTLKTSFKSLLLEGGGGVYPKEFGVRSLLNTLSGFGTVRAVSMPLKKVLCHAKHWHEFHVPETGSLVVLLNLLLEGLPNVQIISSTGFRGAVRVGTVRTGTVRAGTVRAGTVRTVFICLKEIPLDRRRPGH